MEKVGLFWKERASIFRKTGALPESLGMNPQKDAVIKFVTDLCKFNKGPALAKTADPKAADEDSDSTQQTKSTAKEVGDLLRVISRPELKCSVLAVGDPEDQESVLRIQDENSNIISFDIVDPDAVPAEPDLIIEKGLGDFAKSLILFVKERLRIVFAAKQTPKIKPRIMEVCSEEERTDVKVAKLVFTPLTNRFCCDLAPILKIPQDSKLIKQESDSSFIVKVNQDAKPYKIEIQARGGEFIAIVTLLDHAEKAEKEHEPIEYSISKSSRPGNKPPQPRFSELLNNLDMLKELKPKPKKAA